MGYISEGCSSRLGISDGDPPKLVKMHLTLHFGLYQSPGSVDKIYYILTDTISLVLEEKF